MSDEIGWNYPIDESDQWDGFNNSGIEHFAGNPVQGLAREVNQNSFDAGNGDVVKVSMRQHSIKTAEIPDLDELTNTLKVCFEASKDESPKAQQFFESALTAIQKNKISILEISDSNTNGMAGPSRNGTPFYAFTKASGQSKKASDLELGSFGIGKFAPYAVSALRTVFVSTVYLDQDGVLQRLTQGKSILMSHDYADERHRGVGFWGVKSRCQPISTLDIKVPEWIRRGGDVPTSADIGTKLVILGFEPGPNWEASLAISVAENFFGAIVRGQLEVDIGDKHSLTKKTIKEFLTDESVLQPLPDLRNEPEQFRNANHYLSCISETDDVIIEQTQSTHLGLCELRIMLGDGLPKKVAFLRHGMFISDSLDLPGIKNFSDFKEFTAVFECKNNEGLALLRAMEPPRHNDFEPDRLPTKEDKKKGQKALKEIASWVREMLKRNAKDPVSEITTLDELRDFFPDESDQGDGKQGDEINPLGPIRIDARPMKKPVAGKVPQPEPGGGGSGKGTSGDGGNGGAGNGSKGTGSGAPRPVVAIENIRAITTSANSRRIAFTPTNTGMVNLSLLEAGADSDYEMQIKEASLGEIRGGKLRLEVEKDARVTVEVKFKGSFSGALKVMAHEV